MNRFLKHYKYQILLVFIGIIWITLLNGLLQVYDQHHIYPDSESYRQAADLFYHDFKAHCYRPFGMALIFGIPYIFGGGNAEVFDFSLVINIMIWLGSALLVFSFLKKMITVRKAFIFALAFYSILGLAFVNFHLLTEGIYTFFTLLVFWLIDRYYAAKSFHYLSIALGLLLFMVLIKPGTKFLAIVLLLFFGRVLIKNFYKYSMAFIYISVGLIVFQCVKVKQEYGDFTLSYIDGVTYYNYLGNTAMTLKTGETFEEGIQKRMDYIFSLPHTETKAVAAKDFKDQLSGNTLNLVKGYFINIVENTKTPNDCIVICKNKAGTEYFDSVQKAFIIISKYQNRIFTALGIIFALYYFFSGYKKPDVYTLISFYILYTIALSGISSHQGDRFHLVFFPFVIVLAGKFYAQRYSTKIVPVQE